MCDKPVLKKGSSSPKIDPCIQKYIKFLQDNGVTTLGSCCGHGKYKQSIVARVLGFTVEIVSWTIIPRKCRFYKRDEEGYYYIPEVQQ